MTSPTTTTPHRFLVQAAIVEVEDGAFRATQYHPEYTLHEMGRLIAARAKPLVREGIFPDEEAVATYAATRAALAAVPRQRGVATGRPTIRAASTMRSS
jgi:GMP synthase (glutamine-hydrolysing)